MNSGEIKLFIGVLVVAVILAGIAIYPSFVEARRRPAGPVVIQDPVKEKVTRQDLFPEGSWYKGDPKAPYLLVEFADYQCPLCATSVEEVKKLLQKHKGKFCFVFHGIEIQRTHQNTMLMAQAAEAAGAQGKFWEMHEQLFKNQRLFQGVPEEDALAIIEGLAREIGLDMLRFGADLKDPKIAKGLERSSKAAAGANVQATPTFYIIPPDGKTIRVGALRDLLNWCEKPGNIK